jgi:hypothetical protein
VPRLPKRATIVSPDLNYQAKQRLFRGLERFANTGDSPEEYRALAKAWPSFWPLDLRDGPQLNPLAWPDSGHALFLVHRNALRRLWISDPVALAGNDLPFLLGIGDEFDCLKMGRRDVLPLGIAEAWDTLKQVHPDAHVFTHPVVHPHWRLGEFTYQEQNEFQSAVYLLFRESWRAKTCAKCSTYFVAQKPAQLYCSVECSNASHRTAALKWWKEKGAKVRAAQVKSGHKRTSLNRKERTKR